MSGKTRKSGKHPKVKSAQNNDPGLPPDGSPARDTWAKPAYLLILAVLAAVIILGRTHTYHEPFERDIGSHAVIAHEMLQGRSLYSDLWDSKPPGVWVTYALGELLLGYGPGQVFGLGVLAALATMFGAYAAGVAVKSPAAGLWAAAAWAAISGDLLLWANQPNIEVFMNACLIWAFALLLGAGREHLQWKRFLVIGLLLAAATLYKPVTAAIALILGAAHMAAPAGGFASWRRSLVQTALVAGTILAAWAAVFAWFAGTGRLGVFYETVFRYGSYYTQSRGGDLVSNLMKAFSAEGLTNKALGHVWPLAAATGAGVVWGLISGPRRTWVLVAAFLVGAQVAVGLPGRFYAHYYQLLLPGLVVGTGLLAGGAITIAQRQWRYPQIALGGLALIVLASLVLPSYSLSADEWTAKKYGPQFIMSKQLGKSLGKLLKPDEGLYVWGINPELYFWSGKRPPTGVIWSTDTYDGPLAEEFAKRAARDLESNPPELVVVNRAHVKFPQDHPVIRWLGQRYVLMRKPGRGELFAMMIRPGGSLAKRLEAQQKATPSPTSAAPLEQSHEDNPKESDGSSPSLALIRCCSTRFTGKAQAVHDRTTHSEGCVYHHGKTTEH